MSDDLIARVQEMFAQSRIEEVRSLLEREIERGNASVGVLTFLGYAHLYLADPATGQKVLEDAVAKYPDDPSAQEGLARLRWINGAGARFADEMVAAVDKYPGNDQLRLKCSDLLRLAGEWEVAEGVIRRGLAAAPDNASLQTWLGILLDEIGQLDEAEAMFQAALKQHPGHPTLQLNLAHTLLRQAKADAAMKAIMIARQSAPGDQLTVTYTGMAWKQMGDDRYKWLCNYQDHVQAFDLTPPTGFTSMSEFNDELAKRLRPLHPAAAHPLEQSLRGGSQTNQNLIFTRDPVIKHYLNTLSDSIGKYIVSLGDDPRHPMDSRKTGRFSIAGCWSVLLRPNGFHVNHVHPLGWISSAYYVSLPPNMSKPGGHEGWIKFGEPRWPIPGVGIERMVEPKEGRLVLFPSYMWHGTIPFSSGERLTAPFDIVPSQSGETELNEFVKGEVDRRPRRFYAEASVVGEGDSWSVELDGKALRTPEKKRLVLPNQALATVVADEWSAQGARIDLQSMFNMRLANVAVDRTPLARVEMVKEAARYAETDLVCHLAEAPTVLRERQAAAWTPLRDWAAQTLGVRLEAVIGLLPKPQPPASLEAARAHASSLDDFRLTALLHGVSLLGSIVLGLALERRRLSAAEAFELSRIDEAFQAAQWGEDAEAMRRTERNRAEARALDLWFKALPLNEPA